LNAYRKQSGKNDSNARRVAISLARRCLELTVELQKRQRGETGEPEKQREAIKAAIFQKHSKEFSPRTVVDEKPKSSGWGSLHDDDDLFDALN
jgi:hypothetical protein